MRWKKITLWTLAPDYKRTHQSPQIFVSAFQQCWWLNYAHTSINVHKITYIKPNNDNKKYSNYKQKKILLNLCGGKKWHSEHWLRIANGPTDLKISSYQHLPLVQRTYSTGVICWRWTLWIWPAEQNSYKMAYVRPAFGRPQ